MAQPGGDQADPIGTSIRSIQIVTISMVLGVTFFLGLVALVFRSGEVLAPDPWSISVPMGILALAGAILGLAASLVVPDLIANGMRKDLARKGAPEAGRERDRPGGPSDARALMGLYTTRQILGAALLEGAAFFNVVVYMLEGKAPTLLAALVLVGALLARFPTRSAVEAWIDRQSAELAQERHLG